MERTFPVLPGQGLGLVALRQSPQEQITDGIFGIMSQQMFVFRSDHPACHCGVSAAIAVSKKRSPNQIARMDGRILGADGEFDAVLPVGKYDGYLYLL